jgi:phage FluMu gp28-like protein
MQELAEQLDGDTEALIDRWDGRPDYMAEDIFRVQDLNNPGQYIDLELLPYQRKFLHAFFYGDEPLLNVYKGRRIGFSFITAVAFVLDSMLTPGAFYGITSPSKSQSKERIDDIYELIEHAKISFDLPVDNRDEIQFSNGSTIMAFSGNPDTSRGASSAKALLVDEMAWIEDQDAAMQAFNAFTVLGDSLMVQISTPKLSNDRFLENHEQGSETGKDGIISIKQPSFKNAEEIDPEVSLFDQDAEPVSPYFNLATVERERASDPQGFAQEYLCRPISDEYRFFSSEAIDAAIQRGESDPEYQWGPYTAPEEGRMIMGVDIGISSDETTIAVVEHVNDQRKLRYNEAVTDETLSHAGISPADRSNPSAIAKRIGQLKDQMYVDHVVLDETTYGHGFKSEMRDKIGRGIHGFNFTDKDAVAEMMGDLNYSLHNGLVTLVEDAQLEDQLKSIVKKQSSEYSKPKFTGKETAKDGRDDMAMAFALACFPPTLNRNSKSLRQRTDVSKGHLEQENLTHSKRPNGPSFKGIIHSKNRSSTYDHRSGSSNRHSRKRSYKRRYRR